MVEKGYEQNITCPLCGGIANSFNINASNLRFLQNRVKEDNINEALTICATAWSVFPELRYRSDAKNVVDLLLDNVRQQLARALVPLETLAKMTAPINEKLKN